MEKTKEVEYCFWFFLSFFQFVFQKSVIVGEFVVATRYRDILSRLFSNFTTFVSPTQSRTVSPIVHIANHDSSHFFFELKEGSLVATTTLVFQSGALGHLQRSKVCRRSHHSLQLLSCADKPSLFKLFQSVC